MARKTVHYSGRVQGVGFRFTTQRIAEDYQVTGYVRNMPDGRVELVAEGAEAEVERFLNAVADRMSGHIQNTDVHTEPARGEFEAFGIRH